MDEVAGGLGLAGHVRLEVSVDVVLHLAAEGLAQEATEVLQTVGVVGEAEFTAKDRRRVRISSRHSSAVLLSIVFQLCLTQPVGKKSQSTLTRLDSSERRGWNEAHCQTVCLCVFLLFPK